MLEQIEVSVRTELRCKKSDEAGVCAVEEAVQKFRTEQLRSREMNVAITEGEMAIQEVKE